MSGDRQIAWRPHPIGWASSVRAKSPDADRVTLRAGYAPLDHGPAPGTSRSTERAAAGENSSTTTVSSPTTQASWPGGVIEMSPAANSSWLPSPSGPRADLTSRSRGGRSGSCHHRRPAWHEMCVMDKGSFSNPTRTVDLSGMGTACEKIDRPPSSPAHVETVVRSAVGSEGPASWSTDGKSGIRAGAGRAAGVNGVIPPKTHGRDRRSRPTGKEYGP